MKQQPNVKLFPVTNSPFPKMKKPALMFCAICALAVAHGERRIDFGIDAFNASVPESSTASVAFSPFAFELDCSLMAEALDPIGRANVSEALSIMSDFSNVYDPIVDALAEAPETNRVHFLSARTIGVPDPDKVKTDFRRRAFEMRINASISLQWPTKGAERWIMAKLEGNMDDWQIPLGKVGPTEYTLVDATFVEASLPADSSAAAEEGSFARPDGTVAKLPFARCWVKADLVERDDYISLRMPLRGGAFLYVLSPAQGKTLADVRKHLTGKSIANILLEMLDATEKKAASGLCEVHIPRFDVSSRCELESAFAKAKVPEGGITYLYPELTRRTSFQCVRFKLGDDGIAPSGTPPDTRATAHRAIFNRPFVYLVHMPEFNAIAAIGQFTGM